MGNCIIFCAAQFHGLVAPLKEDDFIIAADGGLAHVEKLGIQPNAELIRDSGGSTDFGNVSVMVPSALVYLTYVDAPSHSQQWVDAGKTEAAKSCMMDAAKVMAGMLYDLIMDPEQIAKAKQAFEES